MYAIGFMVFIPLARGEEQEWAKEHKEQDDYEMEKKMTPSKGQDC